MELAIKNLKDGEIKTAWSWKLFCLSGFFDIQLRKLQVWIGVFLSFWIYPAFGEETASKESGGGTLIILLVAIAPWFYTANKWRLWKASFSIGSASASWFFSALIWTVISLVWTITVGALFVLFAK